MQTFKIIHVVLKATEIIVWKMQHKYSNKSDFSTTSWKDTYKLSRKTKV